MTLYLQRFGLQREPFSIAPDPRNLFLSERHREALAHLLYGSQGGGGFVLLTGAIGAGKTTVCRAFLERLPAQCRVAYVFNPQLSSRELLQTVCDEFGIALPEGGSRSAKVYIDALNRFLLGRHAAGDHCLLVVDEAQQLSTRVLEQLRLLTNLETPSRKLLQILLIGQPELRDIVARPELEQLSQRVIARYHLEGLDEAETAAYVSHRLQAAGWQGAPLFDSKALRALHALSGGIPRRINLLADRALLALYAAGERQASAALLRRAAAELRGNTAPSRRPSRAAAALLGGAGLLALAGLGGAALAGWWPGRPVPNPAAPSAQAVAASTPAVALEPAAPRPAAAPQAKTEPALAQLQSGALTGFDPREEALPALAERWQLADASPALCTAPRAPLRCWSGRLSLPALRQLDRPGLVTLIDSQGQAQALLLQALDDEHARLQDAQGRQLRLSPLGFAQAWTGELLTLWRPPPGGIPTPRWLQRQLDAAGLPPAASRSERVAAFQRAEGLKPDGEPGPLTLMRLAQRTDPTEARLQPPRP